MLFGSTGAGKSTLLHLLAGARFSRETVEVGGDDDEFGAETTTRLVPDKKVRGCEIGNSASSTTLLLNSHVDDKSGLTYVDTPGFNNVGDGEDTTVDAANSAAIMSTIRSCASLRVVFLISVKDELNNTRGGQIKKLFEVMDKFIKDASAKLASVFMLFTHSDGFPASNTLQLLNRIGRDRVLPPHLVPFLKHAIALLNQHGDTLMVRPADDGATERMEVVRGLLQNDVEGISDPAAALQCPLSDEVRQSLELACAKEKEEIVKGLQCSRILADARPHLEHLYLLYHALQLEEVKSAYFGALEDIVAQAQSRAELTLEELESHAFSQAQGFMSIFRCELVGLEPHIQRLGRGSELNDLKKKCLHAINNHGKGYSDQLDLALASDDFQGVALVLERAVDLLKYLHEFVYKSIKEALKGFQVMMRA